MPETVGGDGDVKYHLGFSADHVDGRQADDPPALTANPSHLEAVNPVVEGRMRAKQRRFKDRDRRLGVPLLIHGDAAFAGQGLVAETLEPLAAARLQDRRHDPHRRQQPDRLHHRAERRPLDPVLHRRGQDDRGADLPRQRRRPRGRRLRRRAGARLPPDFGKDVVIDMVCYRRHGHNEGDEPSFTQPLMYGKIRNRISIRELYTEQLVMAGELSSREAETIAETFRRQAAGGLRGGAGGGQSSRSRRSRGFAGAWTGLTSRLLVRAGRDGRLVRDAAADRREAGPVPHGLHGQPQDGQAPRGPAQDHRGQGDARLGVRRGAGVRLAALGGHPRPPERPGQPPRHLQPAPRRPGRHEDRRAVHPAQPPRRQIRPSSASTTACSPRRPCSVSTTATRSTSRTC